MKDPRKTQSMRERFEKSLVPIPICPICGDGPALEGDSAPCASCGQATVLGHFYEATRDRLVYYQDYERAFEHWLDDWYWIIQDANSE